MIDAQYNQKVITERGPRGDQGGLSISQQQVHRSILYAWTPTSDDPFPRCESKLGVIKVLVGPCHNAVPYDERSRYCSISKLCHLLVNEIKR